MNRNTVLSVLFLIAFFLSGMPKIRVVFGAPLYFVDACIALLFIFALQSRSPRYMNPAGLLVITACGYWAFILLGELRGAAVYGALIDSVYMLLRFSLAVSLIYSLPRLVASEYALSFVIKGLTIGLLLSGLLAIAYSLPFTRSLAVSIFSISLINPVEVRGYILDIEESLRGQTLIGTSTFSSGVMALLWPLLYMGEALFKSSARWLWLGRVAMVIAPLGILATYGRTAWLSVVLVLCSALLWGSKTKRVLVFFWLFVVGGIAMQLGGVNSELLMLDRLVKKTEVVLEGEIQGESERERFMAYVEPFYHLLEYPSFFFSGTGAAQRRFGGNEYGEGDTASHAVPAMAYYAYGFIGSICQFAFMFVTFRVCYKRMSHARKVLPSLLWMWRSLLGAWCGLLPWWLFAHGPVSQPRGAMAFFLFLSLVLVCERIYVRKYFEYQRSRVQASHRPLAKPTPAVAGLAAGVSR